jgi:hypothetical protein
LGPGTSLMPADAAAIAAVTAEWTAAYVSVTSNATKTLQVVAAKETARIKADAIIRPYAKQIADNVGVTVDNKIALGLNPRTSARTRAAAGRHFPLCGEKRQEPA